MNTNLVESIYRRSSIKIHILSSSFCKHGRHRQFLFLIGRFFSETALPNEPTLDWMHLWNVLCGMLWYLVPRRQAPAPGSSVSTVATSTTTVTSATSISTSPHVQSEAYFQSLSNPLYPLLFWRRRPRIAI